MILGIDASRAATRQRTGTEAYAYFLIQALMAVSAESGHHSGHRLRLYFNQAPPPDLFEPAPHVEQRVLPARRLWTHSRLARELHQDPPDLFFTPAHVIPFSWRGPSVATVHDLGYHHFPDAHPRTQRLYLRWSTRHNATVSRIVMADSEATKRDLSHFYGIDPAKIEVVYPGIDPMLKPVTDRARISAVLQKYTLPDAYLLYLSTLQPRKNLERLVTAYANSGVALPLVLAGKQGWLSEGILATIEGLDSAVVDRIFLPGFIDEDDKAALLSGATALLYPSLYEGFGFPLLEAQACATAVLAANSSSLPEIAGDSALLIDPLDVDAIATGIQQLVADEALRQRLVAAGAQNVARFTWSNSAERTFRLLLQAVRP